MDLPCSPSQNPSYAAGLHQPNIHKHTKLNHPSPRHRSADLLTLILSAIFLQVLTLSLTTVMGEGTGTDFVVCNDLYKGRVGKGAL